jgi:predicted O-methyltransferase YrrM
MPNRFGRAKLYFKVSGLKGLLSHFVYRLVPPNRFGRQATLLDMKTHGLQFVDDIWQMLARVGIDFSAKQVEQIQSEFESFSKIQRLEIHEEQFPHNWNSGESLRLLLFSFIRLLKPDFVVEIGTANGFSTSAIAYAFELNGTGKVHSFDILSSSAAYVRSTSRRYVELHKIDEDPKALLAKLEALDLDTHNGFYFHDGDHTYFGQYMDFEIAKKIGFRYFISDDVETSLVFCEKADKANSAVHFDGRKFIGVSLIFQLAKV